MVSCDAFRGQVVVAQVGAGVVQNAQVQGVVQGFGGAAPVVEPERDEGTQQLDARPARRVHAGLGAAQRTDP